MHCVSCNGSPVTSLALTRITSAALLVLAAVSATLLVRGDVLHLVAARPGGVDVGIHMDVLSTVLLAYVAGLCWLLARYAGRNLAGQERTRRFGLLQLAALLSLGLLVTGASLPVIAVGWTASGLAVASLVAHPGTPGARRAARYVRRTFLAGDAALWAGVVAGVALLPTVNRAELLAASSSATLPITAPDATVTAGLLLLACVVRSALVPAHRWLPETAEAPSPVSALLHAGVVNATGVVVALLWPVFRAAPLALLALLVLGAASVTVGTVTARLRADVKGRLACSTTAQMGWMAVQLGLGLPGAAVLHLVGHGSYKSWLFLRAGGTVSRLRWLPGDRAQDRTPSPGPRTGPATRLPAAAAAAAVALLVGGPALLAMADALGPVVLAPALLMLATTAVAVVGGRTPTARPGARPVLAGLTGLAGAGYLWLLLGVERLLAPALAPSPPWAPGAATALVAGLVALAAALLLVLRGLDRGAGQRPGAVAVLASGSACAPWTRHIGGRAAWPTLLRDGGDDPRTTVTDPHTAGALVAAAADVVSPAWPLRTMVAANPLAAHEHLPFEVAGARAGHELGVRWFLPPERYARLLDDGRITRTHLAAAVRTGLQDRTATAGTADVDAVVESAVEELVRTVRAEPTWTPAPRVRACPC